MKWRTKLFGGVAACKGAGVDCRARVSRETSHPFAGSGSARCELSAHVSRETAPPELPGRPGHESAVYWTTSRQMTCRGATTPLVGLGRHDTNSLRGIRLSVCRFTSPGAAISEGRIDLGRVIAIANQKGGVGKTTTAINLGASLAIAERNTLVIDCDPQGNATSGFGLRKDGDVPSVYDCLVNGQPLQAAVRPEVHFPCLSVVSASRDLTGAEVELIDRSDRQRILGRKIEALRDDFEYILIDSPPSLGLLTLNALAAADAVLIPIQCEFYALEGLSQLLNTVRLVQRSINPELEIEGVLLTMYDSRLNLAKQVAAEAREYFGGKVFDTMIPRNIRLAEAPSFGEPIALYDVLSSGARGYLSLARELIDRHRGS